MGRRPVCGANERMEKTQQLFPCVNIAPSSADLIECESNWRPVTTRNGVMQHCMRSGLWAGEILARAPLRQEKQPEKSHSNPEASLYLNTLLGSTDHSKGSRGRSPTRRKGIVPAHRVSKEERGPALCL